MDMSKYDRARIIRERIAHVDKILEFLHSVLKHNLGISMEETGFVSHPAKAFCDEPDIGVLIRAFERDKKELEEAFEAL